MGHNLANQYKVVYQSNVEERHHESRNAGTWEFEQFQSAMMKILNYQIWHKKSPSSGAILNVNWNQKHEWKNIPEKDDTKPVIPQTTIKNHRIFWVHPLWYTKMQQQLTGTVSKVQDDYMHVVIS